MSFKNQDGGRGRHDLSDNFTEGYDLRSDNESAYESKIPQIFNERPPEGSQTKRKSNMKADQPRIPEEDSDKYEAKSQYVPKQGMKETFDVAYDDTIQEDDINNKYQTNIPPHNKLGSSLMDDPEPHTSPPPTYTQEIRVKERLQASPKTVKNEVIAQERLEQFQDNKTTNQISEYVRNQQEEESYAESQTNLLVRNEESRETALQMESRTTKNPRNNRDMLQTPDVGSGTTPIKKNQMSKSEKRRSTSQKKAPSAKELARKEKEAFVAQMKANCPADHKYIEKMSDQALSGDGQDDDYQSYQSSQDNCDKRRIDLNLYDYEESEEDLLEQDEEGLEGNMFSNALGGVGLPPIMASEKKDFAFLRRKTTLRRKQSSEAQVEEEADIMEEGNPQLENYKELFQNLTSNHVQVTAYDIVSIIITYDSKRCITVTKDNDEHYVIKQYSLKTNQIIQEISIKGTYIKMKEVEQNAKGDMYHISYMDDGVFKLLPFNQDPKEHFEELNINKFFGQRSFDNTKIEEGEEDEAFDSHTIPIAGFADPFITSCFIDDYDKIFVNLFHNVRMTHYHFVYSIKQKTILTKVNNIHMPWTTRKNFPYKTFYNPDEKEIYTFYRQGQGLRIKNADNMEEYSNHDKYLKFDEVYDGDLGQMYLYNNKILVARSSSNILFFKISTNEISGSQSWTQYFSLDNIRGFIYFIKGNKRIQIITDDYVKFYTLDENDEPQLENAMVNFMKCNQMMFGSAVKYCITYKIGQKNFSVYTRKYEHDFKTKISTANYEGSLGLNIVSMNVFLVTYLDPETGQNEIQMYDVSNFQEIKDRKLRVMTLPSKTRERNEIISIAICPHEKYLGVITGKNLIKDEQKPNQLYIFKRTMLEGSDGDGVADEFNINMKKYPIKLYENKLLDGICMDFVFKDNPISKKADTILFAQKDKILKYNYKKKEIKVVHRFQTPLKKQPLFFRVNRSKNIKDNQKIFMIASAEDSVYVNMQRKSKEDRELDIDSEFQISAIKSVIYDKGNFYILANKCRNKLGYYLIKMDERIPIEEEVYEQDGKVIKQDVLNGEMIINRGNKLDIGDANMFVLRQKQYKELIVSYKNMYINTYNVNVIDLEENTIIFRHESFQLWESQVNGFLTTLNNDFVILQKQGISIVALGEIEKRPFRDKDGQEVVLHSLESTNYLKVERNNHILFQDETDTKYVMIQEQVLDFTGESQFHSVLEIQLNRMTLRELLIFQSLYVCKTSSQILELVNEQPKPTVFFKTFLELNKSNMLNLIAFDSKAVGALLRDEEEDPDYEKFYEPKYPVFFTQKITKRTPKGTRSYFRNAIDIALKNNQIGAINKIVWYIVRYQNNSVSSFLFLRNFPLLMDKCIPVAGLLESEVFRISFDGDQWPATHHNYNRMIAPYNGSMFQLELQYENIFQEMIDKDDPSQFDKSKQFKIKYELNILPIIGEHMDLQGELLCQGVLLVNQFFDSEELEIFDCQILQDLLQFKWNMFGRRLHTFGCTMHFFYLGTIMAYINMVYIESFGAENQQLYTLLLGIGISYPAAYDTIQMIKSGSEYWEDVWNYTDFLFIWSSFMSIGFQNILGPLNFWSRTVMIVSVLMLLVKTFFFLRIFKSLSYLVTMLQTVIYDLRIFGLFYVILLILFSLIIDVLGIGNFADPVFSQNNSPDDDGYFGEEYASIGIFIGNIFQIMRISMGDYDFDGANDLEDVENIVYWVCWLLMVTITCIIFLNFIIAEASNSYTNVMDTLDAQILKERASLIKEAEEMLPRRVKNATMFPQYIVVRQMDE